VDSKTESSALSSTRIARKKRKGYKILEGNPEGIKVMEERICERDMSFESGVKGRGSDVMVRTKMMTLMR